MPNLENPFPILSKQEGEAKLAAWSQAYNEPPYNGLVYHYTSVAALAGILSSKSLFCTDYRQLNDSTELTLGLEVLEAAIAARAAEAGVAADGVSETLSRLALLRRASFHISMFCGSFSLRRNDLTQWRAYAPCDGVSIGFRATLLGKLAENQTFVSGAVRYLGAPLFNEWLGEQLLGMRDGWERMAANEAELRLKCAGEPQDYVNLSMSSQRCGNIERWTGEVAGLLKSADFRSEQEWRCVYVLRDNTIQHRKAVHFRTSGSYLIRYVELDLASANLSDLIPEIVVGPGSGNRRTLELVADLCRARSLITSISQPPHSLRP